jgi:folylpolyglutamate synthase/dihydropteroate synthase
MEFALLFKTLYMIRIFLLMIGLCGAVDAMALQTDTSAYMTQRFKINNLLTERSTKFGQYELSLNSRTGIFGMQTKNDIKNSNEILRGIILSDNNIFRELKVLMNYKDQEVSQVQSNAAANSKRIEGYMQAIKKLQDQNEALKNAASRTTEKKDTATYVIIFLSLVIAGGGIYFYRKLNKKPTIV